MNSFHRRRRSIECLLLSVSVDILMVVIVKMHTLWVD